MESEAVIAELKRRWSIAEGEVNKVAVRYQRRGASTVRQQAHQVAERHARREMEYYLIAKYGKESLLG